MDNDTVISILAIIQDTKPSSELPGYGTPSLRDTIKRAYAAAINDVTKSIIQYADKEKAAQGATNTPNGNTEESSKTSDFSVKEIGEKVKQPHVIVSMVDGNPLVDINGSALDLSIMVLGTFLSLHKNGVAEDLICATLLAAINESEIGIEKLVEMRKECEARDMETSAAIKKALDVFFGGPANEMDK